MGTSVSCASVKNVTSMSSKVDTGQARGNSKDTRTFLASNQQSRSKSIASGKVEGTLSTIATCNNNSSSSSRTRRHHFAESGRKFSASVKATSMQFGSKDEEGSYTKDSSDLRRCEWQKSKEVQLTRTTMNLAEGWTAIKGEDSDSNTDLNCSWCENKYQQEEEKEKEEGEENQVDERDGEEEEKEEEGEKVHGEVTQLSDNSTGLVDMKNSLEEREKNTQGLKSFENEEEERRDEASEQAAEAKALSDGSDQASNQANGRTVIFTQQKTLVEDESASECTKSQERSHNNKVAHFVGNNHQCSIREEEDEEEQNEDQVHRQEKQNEDAGGEGEEEEEEEEGATTATDRSIHGSTSDADCPETEAISMAFQLHSLTECTSCSEDNLSHYDDNSDYVEGDREDDDNDDYDSDDSIDTNLPRSGGRGRRKGHKVSGHGDGHHHGHHHHHHRRRRRPGHGRQTRGESDLENADIEKEGEKFHVIEELELDKYELENKSEPWLLSALHQLAGGNLLSNVTNSGSSGFGENRTSKKTGGQNIGFTCSGASNIPLEYQCNSSGQCKLCNLLCPRADASWDLLDTETVTLMDVLERLSRILAEKAKQLISKRKRKLGTSALEEGGGGGKKAQESTPGETTAGTTGKSGPGIHGHLASAEGKEEQQQEQEEQEGEKQQRGQNEVEEEEKEKGGKSKGAITNEQGRGRKGKCDSKEPVGRKKRINPLKDLKDSGIAVKKVENRKRLIILKDGATQYWIQDSVESFTLSSPLDADQVACHQRDVLPVSGQQQQQVDSLLLQANEQQEKQLRQQAHLEQGAQHQYQQHHQQHQHHSEQQLKPPRLHLSDSNKLTRRSLRVKHGQMATSTSVDRLLLDEDDVLSQVSSSAAVPEEVKEWLASTFTKSSASAKKRSEDKPKFRTVANAIRAGIAVDKIYRKLCAATFLQIPPNIAHILKGVDNWSFDVFALGAASNDQVLKYLGYDLMNRYGFIHKFKIHQRRLEKFLNEMELGYTKFKNPYHNNLHAADVTQTVHYILYHLGFASWLTDLEIFATLIAAIIHDFQHNGTTNNFHVQSGSETAILYNDRAVLENFHVSSAFKVILEDDANILANLSKEEYREFRNLVIEMVLSTDMSSHFQQIKTMKSLLNHADLNVDKAKAMSLILHCCDISHPAKQFDIHHRWTSLLMEEFFRQGDKEKELGLPYSPLCDRNTTLVAESQIGFIDFIVKPSLDVCGELLDKIYTQSMGLCSSADSLVSDSEESSGTNRRRHKHHKSSQLGGGGGGKAGESGDGRGGGGKIRPKSLTSLILDKSVSFSPLKKHLSPSSDAAAKDGSGASESNTGSGNNSNSNNNSNNSSSNNNNNKALSDSVPIESATTTSATTATASGSNVDPHQEVTKDKYRLTTTATGAVSSSSSPVAADAPASQAAVRSIKSAPPPKSPRMYNSDFRKNIIDGKICRPWDQCLLENRTKWQERATEEAAIRAKKEKEKDKSCKTKESSMSTSKS